MLNVDEEIASATRYVAKFVQFRTKSLGNNIAAVNHQWWIGLYFMLNAVAQTLAKVHLFANLAYRFVVGLQASNLQWLYGLQRILKLNHLAGRHTTNGYLRNNTFEVADTM